MFSSVKRFAENLENDRQNEEPVRKKIFKREKASISFENITCKKVSSTTLQITSSDWIENFAPVELKDLAIHPKKLLEVQDWFKHCEFLKQKHQNGPIALITGPAGCGKTTSIRIIAKNLNYDIYEWVNPTNSNVEALRFHPSNESQQEEFRKFLIQSSRYNSLFSCSKKKLIIVEDFPNTFLKSPEGFDKILEDYKVRGKCPLIFIITDSKDERLNLSYNLFSDQIRDQHKIVNINFKPVAITFMSNALKRICTLMENKKFSEFYKIPNQNMIQSIGETASGDLRSAVINLHFASLKGALQIPTKNLTNNLKVNKSSKQKKKTKLANIGQDENVTTMHALGRVFNPKFNNENNFIHSPESICDTFLTQPKMFVEFTFANYLMHFSNIEHITDAVSDISLSDNFMHEYREDCTSSGLNLTLRSVMVNNKKPISAWLPVKGFKRLKRRSRYEYISEAKSYGIDENVLDKMNICDYRTYAKVIKKNCKLNSNIS